MKKIPLGRGFTALVDDADFPIVSAWAWTALLTRENRYAVRWVCGGGKKVCIYMHREILRAWFGFDVDHKNGDGFDNRRCNLRVSKHYQNLHNRGAQKNNTSGFKGISWHKASGKWDARITVRGKQHYLGLFKSKRRAKAAWNKQAKRLVGEFFHP